MALLIAIGCSRIHAGARSLWDLLAGYAIAATLVMVTAWAGRRLVKCGAD